ncbi:glycerol kinase GlpK [Amphiplicatus metriothermophilus]|uniref:Glycerol kinase n=1 Tax=Amphiplicatus metriothermophilus TaxID=1519374 RepID=A0A239PYX4_9PROT|nr:glycerol kinase GlpK [Amphiplicatus metriothermophilus]MBB5519770.1 glycerol kinase [Amphiplicatus metriothermophilus]SNT75223.1 glycerol kinase [Amphiplicatus metriothermophilus]
MPAKPLLLAIDQGTTSSRAIVFDRAARIVALAQAEFPQLYPADGWVEHNAEAIWSTTLETARQALAEAEAKGGRVAAIGVTNQRETTLVWERDGGKSIHNAIVWQDRRTADHCARLNREGAEDMIRARTGLLLDPYFSATKIAWILDHVDDARRAAEAGRLAFGTVDSFLIWRLTGGRVHATDATNAARTSLFDINRNEWDDELLALFGVPRSLLPAVLDCAADFGETDPALFGRPIPIRGVAGDQQAAAIGQACFAPGAIKSTYGTGCFVLTHTGDQFILSKNNLLSTIACRLDGQTSYAIEGSIFVAGAAVQWLRDGLGIIETAGESETLARSIPDNRGVYLVPAFTGLGAPHWAPEARGLICGLTRASGPAELARAALESVVYQTTDLLAAIEADGVKPDALRVDGGMTANAWLMQFLADLLELPVERPEVMETTALGAAFLAGLKTGLYGSTDDVAAIWRRAARFEPRMSEGERARLIEGWRKAVRRALA